MSRNPALTSQFIKNTAATLGRQVLSVGVGLVLAVVIARLFGPEGSGQYNLAVLLPTTLATVLNLGIGPANVFFIARGDLSLRDAAHANLRLWILFSFTGIILGGIALSLFSEALFPNVPTAYLALSLFSFPLLLSHEFLASLLQARQAFALFNKTLLVAPIITLITVSILTALSTLGVTAALLAFLFGQLSGSVALLVALHQTDVVHAPQHTLKASNVPAITRLLSYGWKAHLGNILTFVNYRADIFLVNLFLTPVNAGLYVIAVQLAERLWILSTAVSTVLLPRLSELHQDTEHKHQLTSTISQLVLLLTIIAAGLLALLARPLIAFLFGIDFIPATPALLYLLPGVVLGSSARVLSNDLAARGRPELNLYTAVVVVIFNLIGNTVLIPRMGITGAALSTTLAYSMNFIAKLFLYSFFTKQSWWSVLLPSHIAFYRSALRRRHK